MSDKIIEGYRKLRKKYADLAYQNMGSESAIENNKKAQKVNKHIVRSESLLGDSDLQNRLRTIEGNSSLEGLNPTTYHYGNSGKAKGFFNPVDEENQDLPWENGNYNVQDFISSYPRSLGEKLTKKIQNRSTNKHEFLAALWKCEAHELIGQIVEELHSDLYEQRK